MASSNVVLADGLEAAVSSAAGIVRDRPTESGPRTTLFELLSLSGDFARARKQLDALEGAGAGLDFGIQQYRALLELAEARESVFTGKSAPQFEDEDAPLANLHLMAVRAFSAGDAEEARKILEEASTTWRSPAGSANNTPFSEIRDCDDFIAPFLEVFMGGSYQWVGWRRVALLQTAPPRYLRDLVWLPANVQLRGGLGGQVFMPALYPGSSKGTDLVRLGRTTEWIENLPFTVGRGARLLALDDAEIPLPELGELQIFSETETPC